MNTRIGHLFELVYMRSGRGSPQPLSGIMHNVVWVFYFSERGIVAFNAYNPVNMAPGRNTIIQFTKTLMNLDDAYNTSNGKYTGPVEGLYLFSINICTSMNLVLRFTINTDQQKLFISTPITVVQELYLPI